MSDTTSETHSSSAIMDSGHIHAWEEYGDDKGRWLACRCGDRVDRVDLGRRLSAFLVPKKSSRSKR